jgi:hypothetical protein
MFYFYLSIYPKKYLLFIFAFVYVLPTSSLANPLRVIHNPLSSLPLNTYPWLAQQKSSNTFQVKESVRRIQDLPIPILAQRRVIQTSSTSPQRIPFGTWIRSLPLRPSNTPVYLYNHDLKENQYIHEAVLELDTGKRNLQQCADAAMRIYAEYQYSQKKDQTLAFHYTSGDRIPFSKWSKGYRPKVVKEKYKGKTRYRVKWLSSKKRGRSYANFKAYLWRIFTYAGTASLSRHLKKRSLKQIKIGDLFLQGGSPGHAVMVMDLADHPQWGPLMLLAQSYMPAQDMHILKNLNHPELSPWFKVPQDGKLYTPEWVFPAYSLYTFE